MIVDANLLLYARNEDDPRHEDARDWLTTALNGGVRVGLPWQSLAAFLRIATNPRAFRLPLRPDEAVDQVNEWIAAPAAWIAHETERHVEVLGDLVTRYLLAGPLVSDARLAALAIEHGLPLYSTDADFARFTELRWVNPLARSSGRD